MPDSWQKPSNTRSSSTFRTRPSIIAQINGLSEAEAAARQQTFNQPEWIKHLPQPTAMLAKVVNSADNKAHDPLNSLPDSRSITRPSPSVATEWFAPGKSTAIQIDMIG